VLDAFLDDLGDVPTRRDQFEHAPIDLPVAKALGLVAVVTQVADMQPIAEVVKHHATLTAEHADRPGLPHSLNVMNRQLLAPVSCRWLESKLLRRRAGGKQHDVTVCWPDASLER